MFMHSLVHGWSCLEYLYYIKWSMFFRYVILKFTLLYMMRFVGKWISRWWLLWYVSGLICDIDLHYVCNRYGGCTSKSISFAHENWEINAAEWVGTRDEKYKLFDIRANVREAGNDNCG